MASCHTHAATKLSSHRSFWRRRASHRFHGCTQIRRVWHPCHTHAALLGVAAVSAAPTKHSCTNFNYPTEFIDFTEFSGCVYSPTDVTYVHRLGGYGIPAIPTQPTKLSSHRSFWWRSASHGIHRIHRSFWRKIFSHGFHGCAQIRRVWHPAIPTQPTKLSSHRSHRTLRNLTICGHL